MISALPKTEAIKVFRAAMHHAAIKTPYAKSGQAKMVDEWLLDEHT
jgi:hypothetical protein